MPVYVDESLRNGRYLLCAVTVEDTQAKSTRRVMRRLCKPSQRRIHMKHEGDRRRREILGAVSAMGLTARVYVTQIGGRSVRTARDDCLQAVVGELSHAAEKRLVLESCEQDHADRQVIREVLKETGFDLAYAHVKAAAEPLLWLPDIVGWAYGKGADWRRRVDPIVSDRGV